MGQCVTAPRRPRPPHPQKTCWDSPIQPFMQVDLEMYGAILPAPSSSSHHHHPTGHTLEVDVNVDEGYGSDGSLERPASPPACTPTACTPTACTPTANTTSKPVRRVTFNPLVQVREFERETLERIRLVIVPDSESDSLESPVRPRRVRVARKTQRKSVMTFKWDDVLAEVYGKPKVKSPTPHPDDLHRDEGYGSLARPAFREPTIRPSKILPTPEVCKYVLAMNCKDTLKTLYIAKQLI